MNDRVTDAVTVNEGDGECDGETVGLGVFEKVEVAVAEGLYVCVAVVVGVGVGVEVGV